MQKMQKCSESFMTGWLEHWLNIQSIFLGLRVKLSGVETIYHPVFYIKLIIQYGLYVLICISHIQYGLYKFQSFQPLIAMKLSTN